MEEEFLIALRAYQAAGPHAFDAQPSGLGRRAHSLNGSRVQRRITHDAATADVSAIQFELRLYQDQIFRARSRGRYHRGQDLCH
jgi:hypothetical protein